jgi:alpha-ketoglutarate-dependent taurine dioxygenase
MIVIHRHKPGMLHVKDLGDQDEMMRINMNPEPESYLPMVIQSPGGIKGLHYSINTVDGIVGMSQEESDKLFERLNKELMTEKYMWDHWYEHNNDWLFFDNSITNHRRLGDVEGRLAYRVQHGYENIQVPNYNPYYQEEHAKIYDTKLNELNTFMTENFSEEVS